MSVAYYVRVNNSTTVPLVDLYRVIILKETPKTFVVQELSKWKIEFTVRKEDNLVFMNLAGAQGEYVRRMEAVAASLRTWAQSIDERKAQTLAESNSWLKDEVR